ncbi:MAG TPA: sulfite exporter TauE/SafE family protein [Kiritimatiellia bacterium]|jgi:sulfite exporter TauE/SafE|nr:sulfite exporter TauE/SafE family protein [Kiritimatiellia bacterium]HOE37479.1 sulfite exporter TauE/SafE family protein [Kiritimatiellia bacterium]HOR74746.1 sulfite exporter TauE/SafE family protein [Kiritimatiellia bacterium]HOU59467.1 sulfite exporter TauE/SafE family protein [Kiritimatiellia bacterium]HPK69840.1 sulfite exporter TauE/SafE family protein [Kiritimatiellia bacterium]
MVWREVIVEPLLAGLATGIFCCGTCFPFLLPIFAAEQRTARQTIKVWLQLMGGRLTGYLLMGALVGLLGEQLRAAWLERVMTAGMMLMALVLIFYALGFRRPRWSFCAAGTGRAASAPILLGLLLGLQACPPFLLSVAYVFMLHSVAKGLVYFAVFFGATSLYFLPLIGVGWLGRLAEFRWAARLSALGVGILFFVYGMLKL